MKNPIPTLTAARAPLLIAVALAVVAAASDRAHADAGPPCAHHGPSMSPADHLDRLIPVLGLTADQQAAARKLARDATARTEPLTRQAGAQHDEIRALLDSSSPDPTRIGHKVIAMHAIHDQLEAIHRQEMARFEILLTPDQRARLAKLHAGRTHAPHGHAAPGDAAD